MSVQNGKDMLLKIKQNTTYITVAGLKTRECELNRQVINITDSDSIGQWRELSEGGIAHAKLRGDGIFKDATADEEIRAMFFNGQKKEWKAILPDFGELEGRFIITELTYAGTYDAEVVWRITLESAGQITFTVI